jgi:hypothetical protein
MEPIWAIDLYIYNAVKLTIYLRRGKMTKDYKKIVSIAIVILFVVSVALPILVTADNSKEGEGFRGVSRAAGGIPGKPPKPDDPPDEEDPPAVDKWAVVIGIADYAGRANDLRYPDDDARDMYNYLQSQGYPKDNIKLLLNRKARGDAIYAAIDWMAANEGPDSECVFFYSGHGSYYDGYPDGDNEYRDESIIEYGLRHILDTFLMDAFASFESQKIAFIFDSCFSGGMDDLAGSGRVISMACGENELSWEGADWMKNGVFSYYFMEGLATTGTVEGAHYYADGPAYDFVLSEYNYNMNPWMSDNYANDWTF